MWHFLDLTPEQKAHRRELLDRYATIAQLSALIPLKATALYLLTQWIHDRWMDRGDRDIPSSPYLKEAKTRRGVLWRVRCWSRRVTWWAGEPVEVWGYGFAKRGEVLGAAVWTAWLLLLCVLQTGDGE